MLRGIAACAVASLLLAAGPATAVDEMPACVAAAEQAQRQRAAGKLLEARASLQICSREVCPSIVRSDCLRWRADVEGAVPTVVFRAQDPRGQDLSDVKVSLDGTPITDKIDGLPLEVDPGAHVLTGEHPGSKKLRQDVVVRTGDRNRTISLTFQDLEPLVQIPITPLPGPARTNPAAWVFAGTGVAAAGVGTFFLFSALRSKRELEDLHCKPNCPQSLVDEGRRKDDYATVAYGAAILSGAVATYFFLTPTRVRATSFPAREVTVMPLLGGAAATWTERF
jgi:hypothetical protein